MSEPDEPEERRTAPDGRSPAQIFLETEFERCREALMSWEAGVARMRDGQRVFDDTWTELIRNAARIYGRAATRAALDAMGRPEDAGRMY